MVMHARKTQRMSDGYFEKHQAHPYQNSKYGSSKGYGGGGGGNDRYDKFRDSPNGNYRSDSPESSPRDRPYAPSSKGGGGGSYLQKARDKERENRDYKTSSSREKYSGKRHCARSPKDKRGDHRTNNDRNDDKSVLHVKQTSSSSSSRDRKPAHNNCADKRDDSRERAPPRVGDWSEHVSSSGKRYYYNCKTEVSQWEKPREWLERERERFRRDRDRDRDRGGGGGGGGGAGDGYPSGGRSGTRHEKHSNSRGGSASTSNRDSQRETSSGNSRHWSSRDETDSAKGSARSSAGSSGSGGRKHSGDEASASAAAQCAQQDMDISPGDSTPTSEVSEAVAGGEAQPTGPVLLAAALPRLASHPATEGTTATADEAKGDGGGQIATAEGPPTPTHSESADCAKAAAPVASPPASGIGVGAPPSAVTSVAAAAVATPAPVAAAGGLQACLPSSLQALRPQGPAITPSLANYYRDDLVNHVRGWPAEILEKQAAKLAEEAHVMGGVQCSKVSAELKSARSIVRLTEIQATLQEQRILFLRQQIKELEELKSQNSFMSDDP